LKSEIKAFFVGVFVSVCGFFAIIFRRKKDSSNGIGIQCDNDTITNGQNTIRRIQEESESRLNAIESGLEESINILQRARKRMEEENNDI